MCITTRFCPAADKTGANGFPPLSIAVTEFFMVDSTGSILGILTMASVIAHSGGGLHIDQQRWMRDSPVASSDAEIMEKTLYSHQGVL